MTLENKFWDWTIIQSRIQICNQVMKQPTQHASGARTNQEAHVLLTTHIHHIHITSMPTRVLAIA